MTLVFTPLLDDGQPTHGEFWYVADGVFDALDLHPAPGTRREREDAVALRRAILVAGTIRFTWRGYRRAYARTHPAARRTKIEYRRRNRS